MKRLIIFILLTLTTTAFPQQEKTMDKIQNIINNTKQNFAPDKRTAIFDISFENKNQLANRQESIIILKGETNLLNAKESLINDLKENNFEIEDSIEILPEKDLGDKIYGVIDLSVANIRTEPENSAELSTQALLGTPIKVYKKKRYWYLIQTPDKYLGWVDADGFQLMNKNEIEAWNNSEKIIFTEEFGNSYSLEDENSIPVSDLVAGNILKKVDISGDFVKAEYPDHRVAYVSKEKVKKYNDWVKGLNLTDKNIISTAKSFMGTPYLWGGTSVKGMDCSGFTKTVYFLNGLVLPRDASQQVLVGQLIDTQNGFENLKPGDLLFFGRKAKDDSKERVTHVGIYIGNYEFIHSSGRVRINSLDKNSPIFNEYRFNTFLKAKRIIGQLNENGILSLKDNNYF